MYFSSRPSKDNTITGVAIDGSSKTGSNQGKSEIVDLYVLPVVSSSATFGTSRILMQFDLTKLSSSIADGSIPSSSVQYRFRLMNANHAETIPTSFDLEVYPLNRAWDEGRGLSNFDEKLKDSGFSNWDNATSLVAWTLTGSDFNTNVSASQHFDEGTEDLDVDITTMVYSWLTGGLANNGMVIKYIDAHETGSNQLFIKRFFSRHAHVPERRPRLEGLWTDFNQDDRKNVHYNVTGALFYYRNINGSPASTGDLFVDILNSSSTVVQTLTASEVSTGTYQASGVYVTLTSSTQIFRDIWFTATDQIFTGNFTPGFATGSDGFESPQIVASITNLKRTYETDETVFLRVLARETDYKPAIRKSASMEPSPLFLDDSYYEVSNESTGEVIIPFSTGSIKFSKLSYDKVGNYFELRTDGLDVGNLYRIKLLANFNKQKLVFDEDWCIKIVSSA